MKPPLLFPFLLVLSVHAVAASLDGLFKNVTTCTFDRFYYSPWDKDKGHPYFTGRKPVDDTRNDTYVFHVSDTLFGLPVIEVQVPGTWDFHAVTFDAPVKKSRAVLLKKLGSSFAPSKASIAGERPALETSSKNPNQSVLYCNEKEGGE